ncbi:hypothetical protein ACHOLT_06695 [Desulfitobacterium sp. Sab5]|uniref:hypothetical protein n=1 Tax=Desulfitobacterium nosdiversum TaxID=3375356 RepID=UPI003CED2948
MNNGMIIEIHKNMSDYLRSTYGHDFVVEKPALSGNEGFGYHNYYARAYPKEQPDLRFIVNWEKNKGVYDDNYLGTKWTKQGTEVMTRRLREVYGDDFWLEEYWLSYNDKKVKDLDYPDIISKYADKMRVDISYYVFLDNELDKKYEAERAYKILRQNFIDTKTLQFNFIVGYLLKNRKEDLFYVFNSTKKGDGARAQSELYKTGILQNWLLVQYSKRLSEEHSDGFKKVNDINDLLDRFKY